MGIFLCRRNDDRVDIRRQVPVRISDSLLIVKIGHIPDTSNYVLNTQLFTEINGEPVITHDLDSVKVSGGLGDDILALFHREETSLGLVDSHRYHDLIKDGQRSCQDVQMARSEWVERTGE